MQNDITISTTANETTLMAIGGGGSSGGMQGNEARTENAGGDGGYNNDNNNSTEENDQFRKSLSALRELLLQQENSPFQRVREGQGSRSVTDSPMLRQRHRGNQQQPYRPRTGEDPQRQRDRVSSLEKQLEESSSALEKERSLRRTLSDAYERLHDHRKELSNQLQESEQKREHLLMRLRSQQHGAVGSRENSAGSQVDMVNAQKEAIAKNADSHESKMITPAANTDEEVANQSTAGQKQIQEEKLRHDAAMKGLELINENMKKALERSRDKEKEFADKLSELKRELEESRGLLKLVTETRDEANSDNSRGPSSGDSAEKTAPQGSSMDYHYDGDEDNDDEVDEKSDLMETRLESLKLETDRLKSALEQARKDSAESNKLLSLLKKRALELKMPQDRTEGESAKMPAVRPSVTCDGDSSSSPTEDDKKVDTAAGEAAVQSDQQKHLAAKEKELEQTKEELEKLKVSYSQVVTENEDLRKQVQLIKDGEKQTPSEDQEVLKQAFQQLDSTQKEVEEQRKRIQDLETQLKSFAASEGETKADAESLEQGDVRKTEPKEDPQSAKKRDREDGAEGEAAQQQHDSSDDEVEVVEVRNEGNDKEGPDSKKTKTDDYEYACI